MQLTTVLSDSFVAITALFSFVNIFKKNNDLHFLIKIIPFLLMIVAACAGILRFSYFPELVNIHEGLSAFASHVGMVFLFILFYSFFIKPFQYTIQLLVLLIVLSFLSFYFDPTFPYSNMIYTKIAGTLSVVGILGVCISQFKNQKQAAQLGIMACIFSMVAGAFKELNIAMAPLLSIDLFHYFLSLANVLWGMALKKSTLSNE